MPLKRTAKPVDLHTVCHNQQRDAYAEVIFSCSSILEDALREAWRVFSGEGPPDSVKQIQANLGRELPKGIETLESLGVTRLYHTLLRADFFTAWAEYRGTDPSALLDADLGALVDVRNDMVHRRGQTMEMQRLNGAISRKRARDMAKAGVRALVPLGQLELGAAKSWTDKLGEKPVDPPVNNLPSQWYIRLVGREEALAGVTSALTKGNFSRFALEGRAGAGKSSIAREFANVAFGEGLVRQVIWVTGKERYYRPTGQLVEDGQLRDKFGHCIRTILEAFNWEITGDEDAASVAAEMLAGCDAPLLIMDNWESLQGDKRLQEWLDNLPNTVKILYTSRRGVTQARPIEVPGLSRAGATALLSDFLRDSPQWVPVINSPEQMSVIHRETEGNPLLLTLLSSIILRHAPGAPMDVRGELFYRRKGRDLLDFLHDYNMEILKPDEKRSFVISPLLDQPIRTDHLAAALATDPTTAEGLLRGLVEAGLAQPIFNKSATTPFGRERFRVHPFSLEYARRLLVSDPDIQATVNSRMQEFVQRGDAILRDLRDEGHFPYSNEDKAALDALVQDVAREFRDCRRTAKFDRFEQFIQGLPEDWANSAWCRSLLYVAAKGSALPATSLEHIRREIRKAAHPFSPFAIDWLINDALDRDDSQQLRRIVDSGADVDLVFIHKVGVNLGMAGKFDEARLLMHSGMKAAMARETPVTLRQRPYFAIGLAETALREEKMSTALQTSARCALLAEAAKQTDVAAALPYVSATHVDSLRRRVTEERKRLKCP